MANKKTVVQMYEQILAHTEDAEERAFLEKRIEITKKKNANNKSGERKLTPTQMENENIKNDILSALGGAKEPMAVADVMNALGIASNQKISALLTQLRNANLVERTEVKGKPYFALAPKGE